MCTPHLAEPKINGVEKRGASFRAGRYHAILQFFHTVGKSAGEFGVFIKADHEKFVSGIGSLKKLHGSFTGFCNFVGHAAAEIKNNADGNGYIYRRKSDRSEE